MSKESLTQGTIGEGYCESTIRVPSSSALALSPRCKYLHPIAATKSSTLTVSVLRVPMGFTCHDFLSSCIARPHFWP